MTKNLFVRDLESKCASQIQDFFVVLDKTSREGKKGRRYWELVLADCSGQVAARIWECYQHMGHNFESGNIIEIVAKVVRYQNAIQLHIERFRRLSTDEVDLSQLPKGTTGTPDEFATLTEFPVSEGEWILPDVAKEIALASKAKCEELKRKYLV